MDPGRQTQVASSAVTVALRDGTPARIRLVRPDDRARVLRGVGEMSGTSRYMRFFVSTREMTDEQARYFTEVDQVNHVAICAVEPTDAEQRGYGIARFVRDNDVPTIAEFAVAVIDPMQRRGLGTILMAALYLRARAAGIVELRGEALPQNRVMPLWMPRLGATVEASSLDEAHWLMRWPVLPADAMPDVSGSFLLWLNRLRFAFETDVH